MEDIVKPKARFNWLPLVIILLVIIFAVWLMMDKLGGGLNLSADPSSYQAVFLTNNQVYFGKLIGESRDYATLNDIFYLQVAQPLQPSQPGGQVNLVKLGNELHGPADVMRINREHILFVEDLKEDSQVVKAITNYKANLGQ